MQNEFEKLIFRSKLKTSLPNPGNVHRALTVSIADMKELFLKRLENEKLKEENEVIKGQIENLKVLQNDYNDKLDQAAENIEIAKLNLGPSREEFVALEGEVKRIRNSYTCFIGVQHLDSNLDSPGLPYASPRSA